MPKIGIHEFADLLLREVRDKAISSCDTRLDPDANSVVAKRWRSAADSGAAIELARTIIPDCVDSAIFYLLHSIDEGLLRLSFVASDGTTVDLAADGEGEMAGWYMGTGGWRAQFSTERFVDDFADLE